MIREFDPFGDRNPDEVLLRLLNLERKFLVRKFVQLIAFVLLFTLLFPSRTMAAEVLQVRSSSLIQVGDNNRNYTVKLSCLEVSQLKENDAREVLKSLIPRRQRVNIKPEGIDHGILIASVSKINQKIDLTQELISAGVGEFAC